MELEQFRAPAPVCQNHVGSGENGADREPGEVLSFSRLIARLGGDSLGRQEGHLVPQSLHPGEDCLLSPALIPSPREHETAVGSAVQSDSLCCSGKPPGPPLHASLGEPSLVRSCSGPGPEGQGPPPPTRKPKTLAASSGLA